MQRQFKSAPENPDNNAMEERLNESLSNEKNSEHNVDAKPVKITDLKVELSALRNELHAYRVQNTELKSTNRDLNAKLSRLQNTIDNLQRTVREQATKTLDEMFYGLKK